MFMSKTFSVIFLAFLVALASRVFLVEGFVVSGDSMAPTLQSGDYVFVYKLAYWHHEPQRGDIVVATPRQYSEKVVKRVVVLPGEKYLTGLNKKDNLDPEEYFLIGDNMAVSVDSRQFGPVDRWDIQGRVVAAFRLKTHKFIHF